MVQVDKRSLNVEEKVWEVSSSSLPREIDKLDVENFTDFDFFKENQEENNSFRKTAHLPFLERRLLPSNHMSLST